MPIVMPLRSSPTASSIVVRLSGTGSVRVARPVVTPVDEGIAGLVRGAGEVELEGEALLVAVGPAYVDRVDAVERLLGRADDDRVDRGDLRGHLARRVSELLAGHDLEDAAVGCELLRGRTFGGVDHVPHPVLWHEPGQVRGRAERSLLDLRQAEGGVVGGEDDVGVADETDPAAEAETVHGGDDRD